MIEVLLNGMKHLSFLRDKWSELVEFFQMTSNMLTDVDDSVEKICTYGETAVKRRYINFISQ